MNTLKFTNTVALKCTFNSFPRSDCKVLPWNTYINLIMSSETEALLELTSRQYFKPDRFVGDKYKRSYQCFSILTILAVGMYILSGMLLLEENEPRLSLLKQKLHFLQGNQKTNRIISPKEKSQTLSNSSVTHKTVPSSSEDTPNLMSKSFVDVEKSSAVTKSPVDTSSEEEDLSSRSTTAKAESESQERSLQNTESSSSMSSSDEDISSVTESYSVFDGTSEPTSVPLLSSSSNSDILIESTTKSLYTDEENNLEEITSPNPKIEGTTTDNFELESNENITIPSSTSKPDKEIEEKNENKFGCKIPKLDPFDPTIQHLIKNVGPSPKCLKKFPLVFRTAEDSVIIEQNSPKSVGWEDCCYRQILRKNQTNSTNPDNSETYSKECYPISKKETKIPPEHEFIAVYCIPKKESSSKKSKPKMVDVFPFVHLKPEVEERIETFKKMTKQSNPDVNLVVLGIDAVSHMNFQRIMPEVYRYLITNLSAIGMNGYIKIGDNTYPNIVAVLTSQNSSQIGKECQKSKFFDDCPFIWKNFSKNGYRTSYGEDSPWMGIFNYVRNGFRKPPTDYYLRPFARVADNQVSSDKRGNAFLCSGPRTSFQVLLNYIQKMAKTMGYDKRYFQFIWATSLTHDFLNQGKLGQDDLLSTLKWFKSKGYLNNTIFVLMSDHGIRWGAIRSLPQGKIEESMPFVYFVLPEWFRTKYKTAVDNMIVNQERLTTPLDIYETFQDILYLHNIQEDKLEERMENLSKLSENGDIPRGISMFLPVPTTRNCVTAEIPDHYCVCHTSEKVSTKDSSVLQAANYAVFELNKLIANYTKCAYLTLSSVSQAEIIHKEGKGSNSTEKTLELTFLTDPSKGVFEATVTRKASGKWTLAGTISRTNLYGNQSHCVDDKDMKKYCYCLS